MFEILNMCSGGSRPFYYDSGPGPQQLAYGDISAGFFGEVSSAAMFTASDLITQIPELTKAGIAASDFTWLKFAYNGKYVFIAKKRFFVNFSWNAYYGAGLVYGTDDTGLFNNGLPTYQIRLVTKDSYRFKVKTISSVTVDPTNASVGFNDTLYHPSEWTDLLYRVFITPIGNFPTDRWGNYTIADIDLTSTSGELVKETDTTRPTYCLTRGAGTASISAVGSSTKNTIGRYWRPVLELVPTKQLFSLQVNSISVTGALVVAANLKILSSVGNDSSQLQRLSNFALSSTGVVGAAGASFIITTNLKRLTTIKPISNTLKSITSPTVVFNP